MCVDLASKDTVSKDIAQQQRLEGDLSEGAQESARSISMCCVRNSVASLLWCPLDALLTTLSDPSLPTLPRASWGPQLQLYSCLFQWLQLYLQKDSSSLRVASANPSA